jgi:type III restriction enzyme
MLSSDSIRLRKFQLQASKTIAKRFIELTGDDKRPMEYKSWAVPYYQALAALTGAGKTPILADSVAQIRAALAVEPIVLWISKAKAVVDQTFANFDAGGKYSHLIDGFLVRYLADVNVDLIQDDGTPVIALATVGTFNQKNKADGTLRVHQVEEDKADDSLWSMLKERQGKSGERRPLIVVYDEGHNLSDQQTDLLLELEPDAILVASATMKTPPRLARLIDRLKDYGWTKDKLVTSVKSKDVVEAGLVKRQVILGGYATLMDTALDDLLAAMAETTAKAKRLRAGFLPKSIYVCRTNISQEDGRADNPAKPFHERKAPPILIWRYLVEQKGIKPSEIAVYCDLKFDRKTNPPPPGFILYSGGEDDFAAFRAGDYRHIIFNLSLQEGWDDPMCCFAYIDKSMGSSLQVEQVIGRVLRQPGCRHYPDPDLNSANFFIRVDEKQVFPQILETVKRKIEADCPEVKLEGFSDSRDRARSRLEPKKKLTTPEIHIDSDAAVSVIYESIKQMTDFRGGAKTNVIGQGEIVRTIHTVGKRTDGKMKRKITPHSNQVTARWITRREIQSIYPESVKTIDWADGKFDAKIEITSPAAIVLRETAEKLVDVYLENSVLVFEEENPYVAPPVFVNPNKIVNFKHALHKGYSDLNPLELPFASAIDDEKYPWMRNPINGGFAIPLLDKGDTHNFYPDFLVWKDKIVYALDTKGDLWIDKDAGRKLLDIRDEKDVRRVVVRLISKGKWQDTKTRKSEVGYTVWHIKSGQVKPKHCASVQETVETALKPSL